MRKTTLFLLAAVLVAVSTMFFGCDTGGGDDVATPAFDHQTGNKVFLTTTTTGATIYYSVDGSAPTTAYVPASGIVIKTNTSIKAVAKQAGWTDSSEVTVGPYTAKYNWIVRHLTDDEKAIEELALYGYVEEITFTGCIGPLGVGYTGNEPEIYNSSSVLAYTLQWK